MKITLDDSHYLCHFRSHYESIFSWNPLSYHAYIKLDDGVWRSHHDIGEWTEVIGKRTFLSPENGPIMDRNVESTYYEHCVIHVYNIYS